MKKLLFLFCTVTFVLTSCSNDENSSPENSSQDDNSVVPKTISYIYPSLLLGVDSKSSAMYSGNKILNSSEEGYKTVFTYDGDFITKQEVFKLDKQGNQTIVKEVAYTYENGKLKTRIYRVIINGQSGSSDYIQKTVYTQNTNDLISYLNYSVDATTKIESLINEGTLTYENGNLVKLQQKINSITTTSVYDYDTKQNPLKNILGFNLLLDEIYGFGKNNIIKKTKTSSENTNPTVYLTSYIYNERGYPIKNTSLSGGGSVEYEIEYTY
ncbi:hypothetical protein D0809_22795 [Flavobacterium circumlabens]|uniref:DUF4595 domain-containing protein n=1 Tax=Flavobacterium circumlabens TaxID=2133765 RepID=A0A4Y7U622_9FLAO|nr:hypothetical protein [Flavobacterium circumlabens]TCN51056.1 hypothetical protein EV142_11318 [Flavobacterium circumlabens]TEB41875.1 hypothetical protein D0809_22795 [Flavobacterium circumlabens]